MLDEIFLWALDAFSPNRPRAASPVKGTTSEATIYRSRAAYGLNGHRANFVIALCVASCEYALRKSRRFTALFSWTSAPDVSYAKFEIDAEKSAHTPSNSIWRVVS
jgi:hypothetical protein